MPVMVATIVAVPATAAVLFDDFGMGNGSQSSGNPITAAVISRAGGCSLNSVRASRWPANSLDASRRRFDGSMAQPHRVCVHRQGEMKRDAVG
jgi:hypothetical protein